MNYLLQICCISCLLIMSACDDEDISNPTVSTPCDNIVCLNGGGCQDGTCICPNGYTGDNCECEELSCENGGTFNEDTCECDCISDCTGANCENCPTYETFTTSPLIELCPDWTGGDREFSGNGPNMWASAYVYKSPSNKEVWVNVYFRLEETVPDYTSAEKTWNFLLWTAPQGQKILSIESNQSSGPRVYTDADHSPNTFLEVPNELVEKWIFNGDTGGNDVGACNGSDDSFLSVFFNPITVKVIRE